MHIIIRKHELYYKQVNFIVEELELMSIREKHTDKMEEILEKEMYADEGFSEIDEEDQRPETQKVMKQERRQQRKNRRKNWKLRNKIAIVLSLIVSVIAIGYVGTAVFYSTHFFSKTVINGIDCSNKNVKQVEEYLEKEVADYKLTLLEADNKTEVIEGKDISLKYVPGKQVEKLQYTKNGATQDDEINAISGATVTTNAMTNGVNAGLCAFRVMEGGDQ